MIQLQAQSKIDINAINIFRLNPKNISTKKRIELQNLIDSYCSEFPLNIFDCKVVFAAIDSNTDKIIGAAYLIETKEGWFFRKCIISTAYRKLGLQKKLIRARLKYLKFRKVKEVWTFVKPKNEISIKNLKSFGFKYIKKIENGSLNLMLKNNI